MTSLFYPPTTCFHCSSIKFISKLIIDMFTKNVVKDIQLNTIIAYNKQ